MDRHRTHLTIIAVIAVLSLSCLGLAANAQGYANLLCDSNGCRTGYADSAGSVTYHNVRVVAKGGTGDYADPVAAMSDIAAWCEAPSATNPCLLKIMPGVYDIGTGTLQMQQYVDIEGSGENTTIIQGTLDSGTAGVVNGASFAEIRLLTIKSTGAGANKYAMYNNGVSPKVTNVTAIATGSSTSTGTGARGFSNTGSTLTMTNVTAEASGTDINVAIVNVSSPSPGATLTNVKATTKPPGGRYSYAIYNVNAGSLAVMMNVSAEASGASSRNIGIFNAAASAILTTVTAKGTGSAPASYGVFSDNGPSPLCPSCTVTIQNSMIMGSTGAIGRVDSSVAIPTRVAGSQLVGAVTGGNVTCAGVYDEDYVFYASSCPP